MKCPFCGADHDKVVDSRSSARGLTVRRRRECLKCGRKFTTYERPEGLQVRADVADPGRKRLLLQANVAKAVDPGDVAFEIFNLCRALVGLHVSLGGSGLLVDDWGIFRQVREPVEAKS